MTAPAHDAAAALLARLNNSPKGDTEMSALPLNSHALEATINARLNRTPGAAAAMAAADEIAAGVHALAAQQPDELQARLTAAAARRPGHHEDPAQDLRAQVMAHLNR